MVQRFPLMGRSRLGRHHLQAFVGARRQPSQIFGGDPQIALQLDDAVVAEAGVETPFVIKAGQSQLFDIGASGFVRSFGFECADAAADEDLPRGKRLDRFDSEARGLAQL